jgi:PAS domain S-box-containing protein
MIKMKGIFRKAGLRLFVPPVFNDQDKTLTARQVFNIMRAFVISSIFLITAQIAIAPAHAVRWLVLLLAIVAISLVLLEITCRGHVRSGAFLLVVNLWLLISIFSWTESGLGSRAAWGYFIVAFIAGMLLGKWSGIAAAILCSLSTLLLAIASPIHSSDPVRFWLINSLYLVLVLLLQNLASRSIRESLQQAQNELRERQQAEESLLQRNQFISSLMRAIPVAVFFKDKEEKYTGCNDEFTKIMGVTSEELKGKTVHDIWPGEIAEINHQKDLELMREKKHQAYESQVKDKHGQLRPVIYAQDVILDANGNVGGLVGAFLDITGRKMLEEQLRQAQKMEAIGILAGGVAHDFNNILSTIVGYASLLHMQAGLEQKPKEYLERILASIERAASLTHSLLAFSRKQAIELQPIDINDSIFGFHKILARLIGEDVDCKLSLTSEGLVVDADIRQIEQVLMNLATNARDAMPHGGKLTISTRSEILPDGVGEIPRGAYAVISVFDTGTGMDSETQSHLFEPFFTTKEVGKGTGLGLAIVYGIIKNHKGFIRMESESVQGTVFHIYLPLKQLTVQKDRRKQQLEIPRGNETILLVEDDAAVRHVTRSMLEEFGYTVLEAADGQEAMAVFARHCDQVRLLLSDLIMPKKNGKETRAGIMKLKPDIKTIFMSGYTSDIIARKGILEPGMHLLLKPLHPAALLEKIREVLDS